MFKQSHHYIVVPGIVHESCLSLPAFDDKSAFFVSSDGELIIGKHSDSDPMRMQIDKGVSQKQENGFAPRPLEERAYYPAMAGVR